MAGPGNRPRSFNRLNREQKMKSRALDRKKILAAGIVIVVEGGENDTSPGTGG